MTLTLELIRHDVADALGEDPAAIPGPAAIPLDENLLNHGMESVRIMSLLGRRRRNHGVVADFADLAEQPAIDVWAPLLEAA
ncbi:phosphopantetheine-binding protein [Streptomyces sp. QL37]|uniref:phosphopantetheine-binding protein n=1 Tax=Streptomyces sp. QL37 TaxID=2093747 RepID=UPI000CF2B52F|nr:phosphopantetheine-binding protein [Streptomyces sp. QL37]PPQ55812.1 isochorismatase [Streptomyces sp. QL37]